MARAYEAEPTNATREPAFVRESGRDRSTQGGTESSRAGRGEPQRAPIGSGCTA
ncbi:MAG: hypothetical protein R3F21_03840 [Myxococcota bacterium]